MALRVVSKPGQAPPPPTGTAAWHLLGPRRSPPALTPLIPEPTRNFARNSPTTLSNYEIRSLELQRFQTLLKLLPIELRATFLGQTPNTTTGTAAWPSPATRPHKREKTRPARLHQRPHAKKFAQHRHNCPKSAYFHSQGELFRGLARNRLLLGEFFRADGCHSRLTTPANHLA